MKRDLVTSLVVGFVLGCAAVAALALWFFQLRPDLEAVPAPGTVERRIHLTMDNRWDTDHRRRFVCREEAR